MRIVSYNIRKARGLDNRRNPARILRVLQQIDADVVALQEADLRLGARPAAIPKRLIEATTPYRLVHLAATEVSLGWHGNAVLVRHGIEIGTRRRLSLPALEPRGAVLVELTKGNQSLCLVAAHLSLIRRWRRLQLAAIVAHLEPEVRRRTVIAGDFNEWSPRTGLEPLDADFAVLTPGRSYHAARPIAPLDRFALGRGLVAVETGVYRGPSARVASDHLPIWAEITPA